MLAFGKAECEHNVIAFDIACLLQALTKCAQTLRERCSSAKKPNHRHGRLLRARCKWPRYSRAAEQRYELASLHSITSSVSNRIELGTSTPSALAVCRLITNSNFVDCTTGKSAWFAPLRNLPV